MISGNKQQNNIAKLELRKALVNTTGTKGANDVFAAFSIT